MEKEKIMFISSHRIITIMFWIKGFHASANLIKRVNRNFCSLRQGIKF